MSYGELFYVIRKHLGLTQSEMSKGLKISQSALSKIEDGKLDPTLDSFLRLKKICFDRFGNRIWIRFFEGLFDACERGAA